MLGSSNGGGGRGCAFETKQGAERTRNSGRRRAQRGWLPGRIGSAEASQFAACSPGEVNERVGVGWGQEGDERIGGSSNGWGGKCSVV